MVPFLRHRDEGKAFAGPRISGGRQKESVGFLEVLVILYAVPVAAPDEAVAGEELIA